MIEKLQHPACDPRYSFGYLLIAWFHYFIPNPTQKDSYLEDNPLSANIQDFVIDYCATDETGQRKLHTESALVLPKGSWKSGIAAMFSIAELFGPSVPCGVASGGEVYQDGEFRYEYSPGEIMAIKRLGGEVTILATTKEQSKRTSFSEVYRWLGGSETGASERLLSTFSIDPHYHLSKEKFTSPDGYPISVVASEHASDSLDGLKNTLSVLDESHRYKDSVCESATTLSNNSIKRGGSTLQVSTIFATGENSYLEQLFELGEAVRSGENPMSGLLIHHALPSPSLDLSEPDELKEALDEVYESAPYVDTTPIFNAFFDTRKRIDELKRLYLGIPVTPDTRYFDEEHLLAVRMDDDFTPPAGSKITLGLDASRGVAENSKYRCDVTALVGCCLPPSAEFDAKPIIFPIRFIQPKNGDTIQPAEIDKAVTECFETYNVVGFYADPPLLEQLIPEWEKRWGRKLKAQAQNRNNKIAFWTNRRREMSIVIGQYYDAIINKELEIANNGTLLQHHRNAHRRENRTGFLVGKERQQSNNKMDAVIASILAYIAMKDAVSRGAALQRKTIRKFGRAINF